eukprot:Platyproteum_vivax@DN7227_c0_g2_i1.p1
MMGYKNSLATKHTETFQVYANWWDDILVAFEREVAQIGHNLSETAIKTLNDVEVLEKDLLGFTTQLKMKILDRGQGMLDEVRNDLDSNTEYIKATQAVILQEHQIRLDVLKTELTNVACRHPDKIHSMLCNERKDAEIKAQQVETLWNTMVHGVKCDLEKREHRWIDRKEEALVAAQNDAIRERIEDANIATLHERKKDVLSRAELMARTFLQGCSVLIEDELYEVMRNINPMLRPNEYGEPSKSGEPNK